MCNRTATCVVLCVFLLQPGKCSVARGRVVVAFLLCDSSLGCHEAVQHMNIWYQGMQNHLCALHHRDQCCLQATRDCCLEETYHPLFAAASLAAQPGQSGWCQMDAFGCAHIAVCRLGLCVHMHASGLVCCSTQEGGRHDSYILRAFVLFQAWRAVATSFVFAGPTLAGVSQVDAHVPFAYHRGLLGLPCSYTGAAYAYGRAGCMQDGCGVNALQAPFCPATLSSCCKLQLCTLTSGSPGVWC